MSEKPKRPPNSFMLWLQQKRKQIKRDYPHLKPTEVTQKAGVMWQQLNNKKKWVDEAARLRKIYKRKMERLNLEKPKPIKRPLTPYMLWFKTRRNEIVRNYPDLNQKEICQLAGKLWRESTDGQIYWINLAKVYKREYDKNMKKLNNSPQDKVSGQYPNRKITKYQ